VLCCFISLRHLFHVPTRLDAALKSPRNIKLYCELEKPVSKIKLSIYWNNYLLQFHESLNPILKPREMSTSTKRSFTSCDEEKDLLRKHKDDGEFLHLPIHRHKASFRLGHKSSLAVSIAFLMSICFNPYTVLRFHRKVCVTNTQLKPYVVAAPSYCKFSTRQDQKKNFSLLTVY
jgi:hypothetical protein